MATPTTLRRDLGTLTHEARRDLDRLWREVDPKQIGTALHDTLPALIDTYGLAASSVSADWYDEYRINRQAPGNFRSITADIPDVGAHSLIGWAVDEAIDDATLLELVYGGTQRRILNFGRKSIMGSSYADPQSDGWQRTGAGECTFCSMLIGRGAVYSKDTADFASHDNCKCSAVPTFSGQAVPVKPYKVGPRRTLDEDGNPIPDADFNRAKKWIGEHL